MRLAACDTVFFLDYPTEVCLEGIRTRRGTPRPDMPWIETEEDAEFIEFIKRYNTESRPSVLELLKQYADKTIVVFRDRAEAEEYLQDLRK